MKHAHKKMLPAPYKCTGAGGDGIVDFLDIKVETSTRGAEQVTAPHKFVTASSEKHMANVSSNARRRSSLRKEE